MNRRIARRRNRCHGVGTETLETRALLATITVTSLGDTVANDGDVTLREAVRAANTDQSIDGSVAGDGVDTIVFDPSLDGQKIVLESTLTVAESIVFRGNGRSQTIISGLRAFDGITVEHDAQIDIEVDSVRLFRFRNGIRHLGSSGSLRVTDSRLVRNKRGIRSNVDLTVVNSEFISNVLIGRSASGSGIHASGPRTGPIDVTIKRSVFDGNQSTGSRGEGGALLLEDANTVVESSGFFNNVSGSWGGAISVDSELMVNNSTFSGNESGSLGAITAFGAVVTVSQSTIVNNIGSAAIHAWVASQVHTENSVFYRNRTFNNTPVDLQRTSSGLLTASHSFVSAVANSVLTNNGGVPDADGNMVGSTSAPIDPLLAALADNGGPAETRLPLPGSPLIDAGETGTDRFDQRGRQFSRIAGAGQDIGAVERADVNFTISPGQHVVSEQGGSTVTFDVTLGTDFVSPFQLTVTSGGGSATEGSDYVAVNESLSFSGVANETRQFQVAILDDAEFELDEYIGFNYAVDIQDAVVGIPQASVTIESEETTGLGFSDGTIIVGGSGIDDVLTVSPSGTDIVVDLNGTNMSVPAADVTGVWARLFDGDNTVTIDSALAIAARVDVGDGDDTITTGLGDDSIDSHGGDDVITTNAGHDYVLSGAGNDVVDGGDGRDTLMGGAGNDSLNGAAGADQVHGWQGRDSLAGGDGEDTLSGGASSDLILGGGLGDHIYGGSIGTDMSPDVGVDANDTILGGSGEDTVSDDVGQNDIDAGPDDDEVRATGTLRGGSGDDELRAANGFASRLVGGEGEDELYGGNGNDTLIGDEGHDTLVGNDGDDSIEGNGGRDLIIGGSGRDYATGGVKRDTLQGGNGYDTLLGESGPDRIDGNNGNDVLVGGLDDDTISGNADHDLILGNEGTDRLSGNFGADVIIGGVGTDSIVGADGEDLLASGSTTLSLSDLAIARDEWKSLVRTPVERRQNLIDGTGTATRNNGSVFLLDDGTNPNVFDDSEADTVRGNEGQDWFFVNLSQDDVDSDLF